MTYTITESCISCDRCTSVCPTGAVQTDGSAYWIDANLCNDCQGYYSVPQCRAGCPTNKGCIPTEPTTLSLSAKLAETQDYWSAWFAVYNQRVARLKASQHQDYWQRWFDTYSQTLTNLRAQSQGGTKVPLVP